MTVYSKSLVAVLFVLAVIFSNIAQSGEAPYPNSDFQLDFDFSTLKTYGKGSDQWPMSWGNDGNLYAAWGDGRGWDNSGAKSYLGITVLSGDPSRLSGSDLWGDHQKQSNRKPVALVAYDNKLHLFWNPSNPEKWIDIYGATSRDGKTWSFGNSPVFKQKEGAIPCGIVNFGRGYTGVPDELDGSYVYVYLVNGPKENGENLYLARASRQHIFDKSAYEYFYGLDRDNKAMWTRNWSDKRAVFRDLNGREYQCLVDYSPGIKRFMLAKGHNKSALGVFESPTPWGPWKTMYYKQFNDANWKFTYQFPQKWMSPNGTTMWLGFSGWPEYDSFNVIKATVRLKNASKLPTPPTGLQLHRQ